MTTGCTRRIAAALLLAGVVCSVRAEEDQPRLVFTHAMGMMPGVNWWGANSMFPLTDYARSKDPEVFALAYGGGQRIAPLGSFYAFLREDSTYNFNEPYLAWVERKQAALHPDFRPYDHARVENRYQWDLAMAEEMGIDGFGLCLSGNEPSYRHAVQWFKTLEAMLKAQPHTHLRLTMAICGDDLPTPAGDPDKYAWLRRFMTEFKDSPAWLRQHGRLVLMGYHNQITWSAEQGVDPAYMKGAISATQAFLRSLDVGNPIFIFDGQEIVPGQITQGSRTPQPERLRPIAKLVCESFDGYSCWGGVIPDAIYPPNYRVIAAEANRQGKVWMMPIVNIHSGVGQFYRSLPGIQRLLETWSLADETGARAVQLVTWNDTAEATGFQPSISWNYALASLTAKFIQRFKHGAFPVVTNDTVYLFYRKYHADADPDLYPRATVERDADRWGETDDLLHVLVFAVADGTLEVSGTGEGVCRRPLARATLSKAKWLRSTHPWQ